MIESLWTSREELTHAKGGALQTPVSMRYSLRSLESLFAAVLLVSAACSENVLEPIQACTDIQQVTIQVSAGTTPRFTWRPACGMASLQVSPTAGPPGGWVLYSGTHAAENPLPSGIRYGEVPPKGVQPGTVGALSHGVTYRVVVYRWIGGPGDLGSLFSRGSATFVP